MDTMIHIALVNMGYRKLKDNFYAKPVGFVLSVAEVKEDGTVHIKIQFTDKHGRQMTYGTSKFVIDFEGTEEEQFEHMTWLIARREYDAGICEAIKNSNIRCKNTYAFGTPEEMFLNALK